MKAFPNPHRTDELGMTLRDYFAAKAMLGLFSSGHFKGSVFSQNTVEVAKVAYIMADAMLKERDE